LKLRADPYRPGTVWCKIRSRQPLLREVLMRSLLGPSTALALAAVLVSCGDDDSIDDSFSPTVENVSGSYSAITFTLATAAGTTDLLDLGSQVDVVLAADGTTTGQLFVPDLGEGGEDFEADLTGTWTLSNSIVTFNHDADTFIRDVEFTASQNHLTGEFASSDETVRLVLAKGGL
jgi:hypothetical protein